MSAGQNFPWSRAVGAAVCFGLYLPWVRFFTTVENARDPWIWTGGALLCAFAAVFAWEIARDHLVAWSNAVLAGAPPSPPSPGSAPAPAPVPEAPLVPEPAADARCRVPPVQEPVQAPPPRSTEPPVPAPLPPPGRVPSRPDLRLIWGHKGPGPEGGDGE
ncbi:hypothetical protein L6R50_08985 [Myxococcota bacterium]|nr:hypothetical protein [Myxococcota bacterium]